MRSLHWVLLAIGLGIAVLLPLLGSRTWTSAAEPPSGQIPARALLIEEPFGNGEESYPGSSAASSSSITSVDQGTVLTYSLSLPIVQRAAPPYTDDFSNPDSGWSSAESSIHARGYLNGEYRVLIKQAYYLVYGGRGLQATNFRSEVDVRAATTVTGSHGLYFGLGPDGYYLYEVTPFFGGQYTLSRKDSASGSWVIILDWTPSTQVRTGNVVNRLRVDRQGTTITLYVNGQQVNQVVDGTLGGGYVGLAAHAYADNFDVRFDNYLLDASVMAP